MTAARLVGAQLNNIFGWKPDMKNFDIEIIVNIRKDTVCSLPIIHLFLLQMLIMISLNYETLFKRNIVAFGPTTLRSTLCYCMVSLANPKPGTFLLVFFYELMYIRRYSARSDVWWRINCDWGNLGFPWNPFHGWRQSSKGPGAMLFQPGKSEQMKFDKFYFQGSQQELGSQFLFWFLFFWCNASATTRQLHRLNCHGYAVCYFGSYLSH